MTGTKTDPRILEALAKAAKKTITREQVERQRISFIAGSVRRDSNTTEAEIVRVLNKQRGVVEPA